MIDEVPVFSDDLHIYDDVDDGISIKCAEKYVRGIRTHLARSGIESKPHELITKGTKKIHSIVRIPCIGNDYEAVMKEVKEFLDNLGITHISKQIESEYEKWCEVILTNQSTFNK